MKIERISTNTFRVIEGTLEDVAAHLAARGWQRADPRSPHEHSRWWFGERRALIIVYLNGTLLSQGREPHLALEALRGCVRGSIWL